MGKFLYDPGVVVLTPDFGTLYTVYSSLQTYGGIMPSVCILYIVLCKPMVASSSVQTYGGILPSVSILYIVLCKPMLAS